MSGGKATHLMFGNLFAFLKSRHPAYVSKAGEQGTQQKEFIANSGNFTAYGNRSISSPSNLVPVASSVTGGTVFQDKQTGAQVNLMPIGTSSSGGTIYFNPATKTQITVPSGTGGSNPNSYSGRSGATGIVEPNVGAATGQSTQGIRLGSGPASAINLGAVQTVQQGQNFNLVSQRVGGETNYAIVNKQTGRVVGVPGTESAKGRELRSRLLALSEKTGQLSSGTVYQNAKQAGLPYAGSGFSEDLFAASINDDYIQKSAQTIKLEATPNTTQPTQATQQQTYNQANALIVGQKLREANVQVAPLPQAQPQTKTVPTGLFSDPELFPASVFVQQGKTQVAKDISKALPNYKIAGFNTAEVAGAAITGFGSIPLTIGANIYDLSQRGQREVKKGNPLGYIPGYIGTEAPVETAIVVGGTILAAGGPAVKPATTFVGKGLEFAGKAVVPALVAGGTAYNVFTAKPEDRSTALGEGIGQAAFLGYTVVASNALSKVPVQVTEKQVSAVQARVDYEGGTKSVGTFTTKSEAKTVFGQKVSNTARGEFTQFNEEGYAVSTATGTIQGQRGDTAFKSFTLAKETQGQTGYRTISKIGGDTVYSTGINRPFATKTTTTGADLNLFEQAGGKQPMVYQLKPDEAFQVTASVGAGGSTTSAGGRFTTKTFGLSIEPKGQVPKLFEGAPQPPTVRAPSFFETGKGNVQITKQQLVSGGKPFEAQFQTPTSKVTGEQAFALQQKTASVVEKTAAFFGGAVTALKVKQPQRTETFTRTSTVTGPNQYRQSTATVSKQSFTNNQQLFTESATGQRVTQPQARITTGFTTQPQIFRETVLNPPTTTRITTQITQLKNPPVTQKESFYAPPQPPRYPDIPTERPPFGGGGGSPGGFFGGQPRYAKAFKSTASKTGVRPDLFSVSQTQRRTGFTQYGTPSTQAIKSSQLYKRSGGFLAPTQEQLSRKKKGKFGF